jgi:hypothetical protein
MTHVLTAVASASAIFAVVGIVWTIISHVSDARHGQRVVPSAEWPKPYQRPDCYHFEIVPVESAVTGEDIAAWCSACETQLSTRWIDPRFRASRFQGSQVGAMIILPIEVQRKNIEKIKNQFTVNRIEKSGS